MRTSIATSIIALSAFQVSAQYNVTSEPFSLVLLSANSTLNGTALYACHEGAAIEGLCVGGTPSASSQQFHYNTSANNQITSGYLTFTLVGGNFVLSEPMELAYNPSSNVAVPLFQPQEYGTIVQFDESGKLNIPGYIDDTTDPISLNAQKDYYRWYACMTYYGYLYHTLAWTMGSGAPQNPSCQRVDVVRVFGDGSTKGRTAAH